MSIPSGTYKTEVPSTDEVQDAIKTIRDADEIKKHELYDFLKDLEIYKFWLSQRQDTTKTIQTLKGALDWRQTYNFYNLPAEDFSDLDTLKKFYRCGVSKLGMSVFIWKSSLHIPASDYAETERTLRYILHVLTKGWQDGTISDRIVFIIDRFGATPANRDLTLAKLLATVLPAQLPEILHETYIVPTSWWATLLWNAVKFILDPVTVSKFKFVAEKDVSQIHENVDPIYLPQDLRGETKINPENQEDVSLDPVVEVK
ncbi:CRAL-TRIO domain-containing protein [Paraphysoderma sedebokerense]|nr:CRAL-TRIO domain-containing protein [Paraphysoderma sedebokerense]